MRTRQTLQKVRKFNTYEKIKLMETEKNRGNRNLARLILLNILREQKILVEY